MHKVLVLGLGNDLLTDDAVGLHVAAEVRQRLGRDPAVAVVSTTEMGPGILDQIVGHESLIIVDSIQTGTSRPGHIHVFVPSRFRKSCRRSPHALGVEETLALGRSLRLPMPRHVRVVAVEVEDPFTMSSDMTPAVEKAVELAADRVVLWVRNCTRLHEPTASPDVQTAG